MSTTPTPAKPPFNKPWLSYADQLDLLKKRGLEVIDDSAASEFLSHVNYYRFSGYCLAFEQARHRFLPKVTLEQIQAAYEFDRVLRDLATEALEVIELDLRTNIAYCFGELHGAFGHTEPSKFFGRFRHSEWLGKLHEETERSSEIFVGHFKATYSEFPNLPIWMAAEIISFGALSRMFKGMKRPDQKAISARYGRQPNDLASWMHHLVYVRNLCAHHSRLWDRVWSIKPNLPAGKKWEPPLVPGNNRLFATLLIICTMLSKCPTMATFAKEWRTRVEALLTNPPEAPNPYNLMGLTSAWKMHPCWT